MAMLILTVGLQGAGKTTRARELAAKHNALRLTPDEWMIPLFGEPEAGGKRDVLEGQLLNLALGALRLGNTVVLDFGCWSRDERYAIRHLVQAEGGLFELAYLPVDEETQRARVANRYVNAPHTTFPMSEQELASARAFFQAPDDVELSIGEMRDPPEGWQSWRAWAAARWPSFGENWPPSRA